MKIDELDTQNGGKQQEKSCCLPELPRRRYNPDAHLGASESDDPYDSSGLLRWQEDLVNERLESGHFGFRMPRF